MGPKLPSQMDVAPWGYVGLGGGWISGWVEVYVEHQCGGKNDQMLPLPSAQQAPRDGRRRRTQRPLCPITSVSGSDQENIESQVLIKEILSLRFWSRKYCVSGSDEKIFVNFGNRQRRQWLTMFVISELHIQIQGLFPRVITFLSYLHKDWCLTWFLGAFSHNCNTNYMK